MKHFMTFIIVLTCYTLFIKEVEAKKIDLVVNYEALCPDSVRFINDQLSKAVANLNDEVEVSLVPFGKASYDWDMNSSKWKFKCHHGETECLANKIHNCMIHYYPVKSFDYINCTIARFSYTNIIGSVYECGRLYPEMDVRVVIECATNTVGSQLLYGMGLYTEKKQPGLNWVPWIVINGEHSKSMQVIAEKDLISYLCLKFNLRNNACFN